MLARKKGGQIMLFEIDSWILDRHEKFAHFTQRNFGLDCFWWARVFAVLSSLALFIRDIFTSTFLDIILVVFFICVTTYGWFLLIASREEQVKEFLHPRGLNNTLKHFFKGRIAVMLLFLFMSHMNGKYFWSLALIVMFYFESCDPLPPGKSKVKAWLENLAKKFKERTLPEQKPEPQPA